MEKVKKRWRILLPLFVIISISLIGIYISHKPSLISKFLATDLNGTPANSSFTDDIFYKCVVKSYNDENGTSISENESLTDEQLASITELNCNGGSHGIYIENIKGIEKFTSLRIADFNTNQIEGTADFSHNTNLEHLEIQNNDISSLILPEPYNTVTNKLEYLNAYYNKIENLDISKSTLLETLLMDSNRIESIDFSNNPNLVTVDLRFNYLTEITGINNKSSLKTLKLAGRFGYGLTSINISNNTALEELDLSQNKMTSISFNNTPNIKNLDLNRNRLTSIDLSSIQALTSLNISNNLLTSIDLSPNILLEEINLSSNNFNVPNYIYVGTTKNFINTVTLPQSFPVSSNTYTSNDTTKATVNNEGLITALDQGTVNITYDAEVYNMYNEVNIVSIDSNNYQIINNDDIIYIGTDNINDIINGITINEAITKEIDTTNNKLLLKYNDEVLKEFDIIRLNLGELPTRNDKIEIGNSEIPYNDFMSQLETGVLTYKVFDDNEEVTSGNIETGMTLKIYYNESEIDSYEFEKDHVDVSQLEVKNNIIYNLSAGTKVSDITNEIETNGVVKLYKGETELTANQRVGTGDTVVISFENTTIVYTISIKGDITADGYVTISDVSKLYRYIKGKETLTESEKQSARILNNDSITISNVSKLYRYVKGKEIKL